MRLELEAAQVERNRVSAKLDRLSNQMEKLLRRSPSHRDAHGPEGNTARTTSEHRFC
jgi:hypothetical protein